MEYFDISFSKKQNVSMSVLHYHEFYELYFQLSGSRHYFCDNKEYIVPENTLIVTRPNDLHKFENGPYERILISISKEFLPLAQINFLDSLNKKAVILFNDNDMKNIKKTLNKLLALYSEETSTDNHLRYSFVLSTLLQQIYEANTNILEALSSLESDPLNHNLAPVILKIMDYVKIHYNQPITYTELCLQFNLSKTWICKAFLHANGITVFQYKTAVQINKSKEFLHNKRNSISKVAKMVGFSSANYFTKVFKKVMKITPLKYQQQCNEKL